MLKRSEINQAVRDATACFERHGWVLPPEPRWDVTDFGQGEFRRRGLVLVNLADEPEYCEKLMFAYPQQLTPAHAHRRKKEDIICRRGELQLRLWPRLPAESKPGERFRVQVNGEAVEHTAGEVLTLAAGSRITLVPGVYHEFWPTAEETIIGEVSTANDDLNDNFFVEPIARFSEIEEDQPAIVRLVSEA